MAFYINGTQVAEPAKEGVVITKEPLWTANTGRSASGKMTGDLLPGSPKTTISVTWPVLTFAETNAIITAIEGGGSFFKIKFTKDLGGTGTNEWTVYASNIPRTVYSLATGYKFHTGVTVTFIEQ